MRRVVSLFTGIGGLDLGFERAGFKTVGMCEIDPKARSVLDRHWADVPKHNDIKTLHSEAFGPAEVVVWGSPCQNLSIAGDREGLEGSKSRLFVEGIRFIEEMRRLTDGEYPKFSVWENVPGAFSSNGGSDFATVLSSFIESEVPMPRSGRWAKCGVVRGDGRSVAWRVLDSQHFGVPQRRQRVFVVTDFGGERAEQVLLEWSGVRGDTPSSAASGEVLDDTPTRGSGVGGGEETTTQANHLMSTTTFVAADYANYGFKASGVAHTLTSSADRSRAAPLVVCDPPVAFAENSRGELRLKGGDGNRTGALSTGGGKPGQGKPMIVLTARTVTTGTGRRFDADTETLVPSDRCGYSVRRLTPRETERLQGFPDDWTRYAADGTEIADTHRYRMMGNAVTVNVAEWIAERVKQVMA